MCHQGGLSPHEAPPHFFVVVNFAQVACIAGNGDGDGGVAGMQIPRTPPGMAMFGTGSGSLPAMGSKDLGGGGGGQPPEWKGILAELIYMCSGAVLLGA